MKEFTLNEMDIFLQTVHYDENQGVFFYKRPAGTINDKGYVSIKSNKMSILAHRLIWMIHNGEIRKGMMIDHINGNKSDNKISNLRLATKSQNATNAEKKKYSSSKFKGVVKNESGKYVAYIRHQGRGFNLGTYDNEEDAAKAYDDKARELFKSYSRPNFSCKHEPTFVNDGDTTNWKFSCKHCGVKVEAEWKEVK